MKTILRFTMTLLVTVVVSSACRGLQSDHAGPAISDISTSGKVLVISDCLNTSVTITAKVRDDSQITSVMLWYRVGADQPFKSTSMDAQENLYTASVKGSELQGNGYGAMEFYVTAQDGAGNSSKSPLDHSIQFLPCVSH